MKKNDIPFRHLGLFLLALGIGCTACSSDDDNDELISPDKGVVKTQMAVSVPQGERSGRMTAQTVQELGNFRGMSNIWLVSLKSKGDTWDVNGPLNELGAIAADGFDGGKANVKVYKDIDIKGGTEQMLFYGKATPGINADAFEEGALTSNLMKSTASIADIEFSLQSCMPTQNADFDAAKTALLAGINGMLQAAAPWKEPGATALQKSFFEKMRSMRAGSAEMIRLTLQSIYQTISEYKLNDGAALGDETVVTAILKSIASPTSGTAVLFDYNSSTQTLQWHDAQLGTFPSAFKVPEGAVQLEYVTESNSYQYADDSWIGGVPPGNSINLKNICYPAALAYYVQSPLLVNTKGDIKDWSNVWTDNRGTDWKQKAVDGSTRAIALENKVQYGTALLKTAFKCGKSTLPDSRGKYEVPVNIEGFPVTGILVGGQPVATGWNFLPKEGTTMEQVVYDRELSSTLKAVYREDDPTDFNYTLVMPNKHSTDKDVHVAVELKNNTGEEIYGVDHGIIPTGGTFYLVGTLKMPANLGIDNAIFEPDHYTKVIFTINSLKNAYVTIPDLRSVRLQVGMYVDIQWGKYEYGETDLGV